MKIQKEYATLIAIVIVLIFFLGLINFINSNFKNTGNIPNTNQNVVVSSNKNESKPPEPPEEKTLSFASLSCTTSGGRDTIKLRIQSTGITIQQDEMTTYVDSMGVDFLDANGRKLSSLTVNAGTTTIEFSFTAADHKSSRKITISTPASAYEQTVACS